MSSNPTAADIMTERLCASMKREEHLQQRLTAADDWADLIQGLLRRLVRNIDQECYCAEDLEQQDDQFSSIIKSIRAELKAADGSKPSTCTWSEGGFSWHTGCGKEWQFTDGGLPAENGMHFCHSCGKKLVVESAQSA
ncbi:hypothetical protein [Pseudomonas sp. B19125]|uniref:hypothetical protein n=1 Tax=Pseudomonas sp. B19125 TaxID=3235109 RepID=UPI0037835435